MNIPEAIQRALSNNSFIDYDEFESIYEAMDQERLARQLPQDQLVTLDTYRRISVDRFRFPEERNNFFAGYASRYWASHRNQIRDVFFTRLERILLEAPLPVRADILGDLLFRQRHPTESSTLRFQVGFRDFSLSMDCIPSTTYSGPSSLPGALQSIGGQTMGAAGLVMASLFSGRSEEGCRGYYRVPPAHFWQNVLNVFPAASLNSQGLEITLRGLENREPFRVSISTQEIRERLSGFLADRPRNNFSVDLVLRPQAGLSLWSDAGRDPRTATQASFFSGVDVNLVLGGRNYLQLHSLSAEQHRFFMLGGYQYTLGDAPYTHLIRAGAGWRGEFYRNFHDYHPRVNIELGFIGLLRVDETVNPFGFLIRGAFDYRFLKRWGAGAAIEMGVWENGFLMNLGLNFSLHFL